MRRSRRMARSSFVLEFRAPGPKVNRKVRCANVKQSTWNSKGYPSKTPHGGFGFRVNTSMARAVREREEIKINLGDQLSL